MVENTTGLYLDPSLFEPELNDQEKALRELFVQEYLKDFNTVQACLRVGFQAAFATEYAKRFIQEPYVQRRIAELRVAAPSNEELQAQQDKALVLSVLREEAQNGQSTSRVAAARQLAAIYKMDQPDGSEASDQALVEAFREFAAKVPV